MSALLELEDLSVCHGQLTAVDHVSLAVEAGQVLAVIGANGAGKSTLLRTIAGLHRPVSGTIRYDGTDITNIPIQRRVADGIVLVPEGRRLFPSLSVEENLLVGTYRSRQGPFSLSRIYEMFPWMASRRKEHTGQLSGGQQQAVAIGRALVANPRLLLLDELSLGLAPIVVRQIYAMLPELLNSGITVLLVEQDVSQALSVAQRIHCLLEGRTTLSGKPSQFHPSQIEEAYFGVRSSNHSDIPG
ncbi:MAG: ABC transporter ATP-binding protein [Actinobacteria bacterium]|jgi:branched-chain amino acid transport system ATP-binding protein|nr:ABC transporter ATP-binding protein [Actinomycetota bacterium]